MRSADVTQGYLYFSADELREPAEKIEHKILQCTGLNCMDDELNKKIIDVMLSLTEESKIYLLKSLLDGGINE